MTVQFSKYHGAGNDFILVDNRDGQIRLSKEIIAFLCHRRFGIGADGLMTLENAAGYDFKMVYYNADGAEGSMCGNGGRVLARFAADSGIQGSSFRFIATDGPHEAIFENDGNISLKMMDVHAVDRRPEFSFLNTGSPHVVMPTANLANYPVFKEGSAIRYSPEFEAKGTNVNFVEQQTSGQLYVRTYERGVEDETLSCGTGVTACALALATANGQQTTKIQSMGGQLAVSFLKEGDSFTNIWLTGPAQFVFKGQISMDD